MRSKALSMEKAFLASGKLTNEGDIFYLKSSEIEALQRDELDREAARRLIRRRRRAWRSEARRAPVETVNIQLSERESTAESDTQLLYGQCACGGDVEGRARIILHPSQGHTLVKTDVLIAPYTDPAWTPLFTKVAAVIVGTGSFLSHAGTVARELHVPCIVDVKDATARIHEGDQLRIRADAGRVEIIG